MTKRDHPNLRYWTCTCGKRAFATRRDAKHALKLHPHPDGMRPYRCDHSPIPAHHLGHLNGYTRDEHRQYHQEAA